VDPLVTRVFCACCCALALLAAPALSASAPLTLRQAIQAALAGNPDLAGFAFELRAQEARTDAAGLRPAPTLSVGIENALGNGEHRRFDAAESTFALSQVVELGGKRAARVGAARRAVHRPDAVARSRSPRGRLGQAREGI